LVMNLLAAANDVENDPLSAIIVAGPQHGAVVFNPDGSFTYTAAANYNGADSFTYQVNDGHSASDHGDSNIATVTLAVASVNDAPTGTSTTVTTLEDTPYVFKLADFGFSDAIDAASTAGANNFSAVTISSLPLAGSLTNNGITVAAGQSISVAEIAAGLLRFSPAANANGTGYASFTFQVQDDGGTANGGINTDPVAKTLTLNVTSVNDAPTGTSTTVTTLEDTPYVFQLTDFGFSDAIDAASAAGANNFSAVTISSLPLAGTLTNNGIAVAAGQSISVAEIAAGLLRFSPAANANGAGYASFTFKVQDDGGTANGGINTDPVAKTLTLSVTSVNDAPTGTNTTVTTLEDTPYVFKLADFGFSDAIDAASTAGANNFASVVIGNLPLAGSFTLNGVAVSSGQSIAVADITAGLLQLAPALNANGTAYASFTFKVQDDGGTANGGINTDQTARTMSINVTPVNDAPVAVSATVAGTEDTPYIFSWSDFKVSDVDSTDTSTGLSTGLAITINTLPVDGLLQYYDGIQWLAVSAGQRITKVDIDLGLLCFGPDANESGFAGYSTVGTGNNKQHYASFTYQADDGFLSTAVASMTVNIVPVADAPTVVLSQQVDAYGATAMLFNTGWESVANRNNKYTVVTASQLDGWSVVKEVQLGDNYHYDRDGDGRYDQDDYCDNSKEAFIIWGNDDKMKDANNNNRYVTGVPNTGRNWLELGNAMDVERQTYGIERTVTTRAGATYDLNLDYAGRLGLDLNHTRIGIYVDGVLVGSHTGTSSNMALNWESLNFSFTGHGGSQNIRIVIEGVTSEDHHDHHEGEGRGAMIDNLVLTENMPINTGYQDSAIRLSSVIAALTDSDGSETLGVTIGAIPAGSTLTDGTHSFTATATLHDVAVTGWSLGNLSITPPGGYTGTFSLTVTATATESASTSTASYTVALAVTVVSNNVTSPIVLDLNGDGIHTTALGATQGKFDLLNNGSPIASGWISAGDAFLAVDLNGNGMIDNRSELFGGKIGEGYSQLSAYDSNHDGLIDYRDERFNDLEVWQDSNSNHRTDAGELRSLGAAGVSSLSLSYTIQPVNDNGNLLLETSAATLADGRTISMADVYFRIGRFGQARSETSGPETAKMDAGVQSEFAGITATEVNPYIRMINTAMPQVESEQKSVAASTIAAAYGSTITGSGSSATIAISSILPADNPGSVESTVPALGETVLGATTAQEGMGDLIIMHGAANASPAITSENNASSITFDWSALTNPSAEYAVPAKSTSISAWASAAPSDNWLHDFLGIARLVPVNLADSTGLSVTLPKTEESEQPFVERRQIPR
jgi:hypothetical protein